VPGVVTRVATSVPLPLFLNLLLDMFRKEPFVRVRVRSLLFLLKDPDTDEANIGPDAVITPLRSGDVLLLSLDDEE